MAIPKRVVITIHGIRTDGEWQNKVADLLSPYYECAAFRYPEYRHSVMSVVWLAFELIGALFGIALIAWTLIERQSLAASHCWVIICSAVFLWLTTRYFASARREKVLSDLREFFSKQKGSGLPPHVIAHSLGTLLIGMLLKKYEDVNIGTLILNGCVLNRRFRWRAVENRCEYVRNEMACKDSVSKLAGLLHSFIPSMGSAGAFGFRRASTVVGPHKPAESKCNCPRGCSTGIAEGTAWVDNVRHELYLHSDYYISDDHQRYFWIPALWRFNPSPFAQFLDKCRKGMELLQHQENLPEDQVPELYTTPELDELERELSASCWGWARGTVGSYLLRQWSYVLRRNEFKGVPIDALTATSLRMLWTRIGWELLNAKPIPNPEKVFLQIQRDLLRLLGGSNRNVQR